MMGPLKYADKKPPAMSALKGISSEVGTYSHSFPVVRGIQAGREYYVTMCPLGAVSKLFVFDQTYVPAELRSQRAINRARIPEIAKYVINNPRGYTFSALTASVDSRVHFSPLEEFDPRKRIGILHVPMDARLVINDGQHRRAALEQAVKTRPELAHESIPIVLFIDAGLRRSQQMFADLNRYAIRPTRSLAVLYDHRDNLATLVRELVTRVPLFRERIEMEKTTVTRKSTKLFTLGSVYQANMALLGKTKQSDSTNEGDLRRAVAFWHEIPDHILEWRRHIEGNLTSMEIRRDYIHGHSVALQALGNMGNTLLTLHPSNWTQHLAKLRHVDWSKTNPDWNGRAIFGGRMSNARVNVALTSAYLKRRLRLRLSDEELRIEGEHLRDKWN